MTDIEICITALETWPLEARPKRVYHVHLYGLHEPSTKTHCEDSVPGGNRYIPHDRAIDLFIASGLKWLLTQHADVMLFHKADWYKSSTPMFVSGACPTFLSAIHSAITSQGIDAGKGGGA